MVSHSQNSPFYQNDIDLDPMTLILKLDLDKVKMYHHAKIKSVGQCIQKILPVQTNKQT